MKDDRRAFIRKAALGSVVVSSISGLTALNAGGKKNNSAGNRIGKDDDGIWIIYNDGISPI